MLELSVKTKLSSEIQQYNVTGFLFGKMLEKQTLFFLPDPK